MLGLIPGEPDFVTLLKTKGSRLALHAAGFAVLTAKLGLGSFSRRSHFVKQNPEMQHLE
jgi:hypothetical protein